MEILLTIGFPTYNRSDKLYGALCALVVELGPRWLGSVEILVSDNASTDATREVVERFRTDNSFLALRYVRHADNRGMDENFHYVLKSALGRHVLLLSDDDVLVFGGLSSILGNLNRLGEEDVYCIDSPGFARGVPGINGAPVSEFLMSSDPQNAMKFMACGLFFLSSTIVPTKLVPPVMEDGKGSIIFTAYIFSFIISKSRVVFLDRSPFLHLNINGRVSYDMPAMLVESFHQYYKWLSCLNFQSDVISFLVQRHYGWFLKGCIIQRKLQKRDLPLEYYREEQRAFRSYILGLAGSELIPARARNCLLIYTYLPSWFLVLIRAGVRLLRRAKKIIFK